MQSQDSHRLLNTIQNIVYNCPCVNYILFAIIWNATAKESEKIVRLPHCVLLLYVMLCYVWCAALIKETWVVRFGLIISVYTAANPLYTFTRNGMYQRDADKMNGRKQNPNKWKTLQLNNNQSLIYTELFTVNRVKASQVFHCSSSCCRCCYCCNSPHSHRSINERSNYTLHIRCARENKISFEWRNKWHYAWRWCNYGNRSAMHIAHIMRIRMTLHCNGSHTQSILDWAFRMCCSNFSASDSKKSASVRVNVEKWTQLITDQFCERINEMRCNFDCKNSEFHAVWSLSEWICHINF